MMDVRVIEEPELQFGIDRHICPRAGIYQYGVYDSNSKAKKKEIQIGVVGLNEDVELFYEWIERSSTIISAKTKIKQKNLYPAFIGFNSDTGFKAKFIVAEEITKRLNKKEIKVLLENKHRNEMIESVLQHYYEAISYIALNKKPDVIVCLIPNFFENTVIKIKEKPLEEKIEDDEEEQIEMDFRRAIKAKCMHLAVPLQLIKENSLKDSKGIQDEATLAWNLCTALYYKANGTPWRLVKNIDQPSVCFIGIGFYNSRDKKSTQTSLAQVFDELGNGVILRGSDIQKNKKIDRQPHLDAQQSYDLLKQALNEYRIALGNFPARLVIHKSSLYSEEEQEGFAKAMTDFNVGSYDFITILDAELRLFRNGMYPPYRGSQISIGNDRHLLYTRGSVEYYETYPGMYIPKPLDIRIVESNQSANTICEEILALTKMNWNNTQFDGKYPITISCARKVGQIMKYLPAAEKPQIRYSFYM